MSLSGFDVIGLQPGKFRSSQTTTKEHGQHRIVPFGTKRFAPCSPQYGRALILSEPIPRALAQLLYAFHPCNTGGKVRAKKTGIGGLMRQPAHGCEMLVDGVSCQGTRFHVDTITNYNNAIERQPRLGTVPRDELLDCMFIDPSRIR
jgi:hypothetical protein